MIFDIKIYKSLAVFFIVAPFGNFLTTALVAGLYGASLQAWTHALFNLLPQDILLSIVTLGAGVGMLILPHIEWRILNFVGLSSAFCSLLHLVSHLSAGSMYFKGRLAHGCVSLVISMVLIMLAHLVRLQQRQIEKEPEPEIAKDLVYSSTLSDLNFADSESVNLVSPLKSGDAKSKSDFKLDKGL